MANVVEIKGIEEINYILRILPNKVNRKVLLSALRKSAAILRSAAQRNARAISTTLAKSIGTVTDTSMEGKEKPAVYVGPRHAAGRGSHSRKYSPMARKKGSVKYDGWFAHFWEFGTSVVRKPARKKFLSFVSRGGEKIFVKQTRGITARPFMRPAWMQTKDAVVDSIADNVGTEIDKFFKKHAPNYR